jgi:hypothetical protein
MFELDIFHKLQGKLIFAIKGPRSCNIYILHIILLIYIYLTLIKFSIALLCTLNIFFIGCLSTFPFNKLLILIFWTFLQYWRGLHGHVFFSYSTSLILCYQKKTFLQCLDYVHSQNWCNKWYISSFNNFPIINIIKGPT